MKLNYRYLKHHENKHKCIFQDKELLIKKVQTYDSSMMAGAIRDNSVQQIKAGVE